MFYQESQPLDEAIRCGLIAEWLIENGYYHLLVQVHQCVRRDLSTGLPGGQAFYVRTLPCFGLTPAPPELSDTWDFLPQDTQVAYLELSWLIANYVFLIPDGPLATVRTAFSRAMEVARSAGPLPYWAA
jgi:hypothetical protein